MRKVEHLKHAIENQHGGVATFAFEEYVREEFHDQVVWEGVVHVFDLAGHPTASRAFAWSSLIESSDKRRYYAVLGIGSIKTPLDAVRAAIVAEHKGPSC